VLYWSPNTQTPEENKAISEILGVDRIVGDYHRDNNFYTGQVNPNPQIMGNVYSSRGLEHGGLGNMEETYTPFNIY
jgi:hypothetical protein